MEKILEELGKKRNKKIFQFNEQRLFPIFVDRNQLFLFFNNMLEKESFQKELKKLEGITISFPKTFKIGLKDFDKAVELLEA